jgi:hypothetical protein
LSEVKLAKDGFRGVNVDNKKMRVEKKLPVGRSLIVRECHRESFVVRRKRQSASLVTLNFIPSGRLLQELRDSRGPDLLPAC